MNLVQPAVEEGAPFPHPSPSPGKSRKHSQTRENLHLWHLSPSACSILLITPTPEFWYVEITLYELPFTTLQLSIVLLKELNVDCTWLVTWTYDGTKNCMVTYMLLKFSETSAYLLIIACQSPFSGNNPGKSYLERLLIIEKRNEEVVPGRMSFRHLFCYIWPVHLPNVIS